jgi:hypothetical protein
MLDMFRTLKDAKAAGYLTAEDWIKTGPNVPPPRPMIPRRGSTPIMVKRKPLFCVADCEEVVSKPEALRRGLSVTSEAQPVAWRRGEHSRWPLFRLSDCKPKRKASTRPAAEIDILLATFTVNRAAKRYRDAASVHYRDRRRGLSQTSKEKKEWLYELKEAGIAEGYLTERLSFVGIAHGLALYRGECYCFHSCLLPRTAIVEDQGGGGERILIEAAQKGAREARLKDAELTLSRLPDPPDEIFDRLPQPKMARQRPQWERRGGCGHERRSDFPDDHDDAGDDQE